MEDFLLQPLDYLKNFTYDHSTWRFIFNPQMIFFGKPTYLLHEGPDKLEELVDQWIDEIDKDFKHVIILEQLFESLAVMMIKMCWDINDMISLRMNTATVQPSKLS